MEQNQPTVEQMQKCWTKKQKKKARKKELRLFYQEVIQLLNYLEVTGKKVHLLIEGRDAAGKGRFIKFLKKKVDPKKIRTVALEKPTEQESGQNYFQRYIKRWPDAGHVACYDRSYYNSCMVEPVCGFSSEDEHKQRMKTIPNLEKLATFDGETYFIKIFFSITPDVQKKRLGKRAKNPLTKWKMSIVDKQALAMSHDYTEAEYLMFQKTCTQEHPWTIVNANQRYEGQINALKHILNVIPYSGKSQTLDFSIDPNKVCTGQEEVEKLKKIVKVNRFDYVQA